MNHLLEENRSIIIEIDDYVLIREIEKVINVCYNKQRTAGVYLSIDKSNLIENRK
jgi:hypothetical protein